MPRLSDTMDSGTIARWLKREGDQVKRGEIIAEIETDKANMELESFANGVLARILVAEGQSAESGPADCNGRREMMTRRSVCVARPVGKSSTEPTGRGAEAPTAQTEATRSTAEERLQR